MTPASTFPAAQRVLAVDKARELMAQGYSMSKASREIGTVIGCSGQAIQKWAKQQARPLQDIAADQRATRRTLTSEGYRGWRKPERMTLVRRLLSLSDVRLGVLGMRVLAKTPDDDGALDLAIQRAAQALRTALELARDMGLDDEPQGIEKAGDAPADDDAADASPEDAMERARRELAQMNAELGAADVNAQLGAADANAELGGVGQGRGRGDSFLGSPGSESGPSAHTRTRSEETGFTPGTAARTTRNHDGDSPGTTRDHERVSARLHTARGCM